MGNIFVVAAWIVGKGRQGRFICGQTSNHENHEYFAPRKLYGISHNYCLYFPIEIVAFNRGNKISRITFRSLMVY